MLVTFEMINIKVLREDQFADETRKSCELIVIEKRFFDIESQPTVGSNELLLFTLDRTEDQLHIFFRLLGHPGKSAVGFADHRLKELRRENVIPKVVKDRRFDDAKGLVHLCLP